MSRDGTDAHYLHERHGLEAVLRPPVSYPTALQWVPKREQLVVCTRDGQLTSVDPILGTRIVAEGIGEAAAAEAVRPAATSDPRISWRMVVPDSGIAEPAPAAGALQELIQQGSCHLRGGGGNRPK